MSDLEYANIFDAVTDDPAEALELERKADLLITERELADHKLPNNDE